MNPYLDIFIVTWTKNGSIKLEKGESKIKEAFEPISKLKCKGENLKIIEGEFFQRTIRKKTKAMKELCTS